jgi:formate-dependent nitrite reductase cytochrome c552 subunit
VFAPALLLQSKLGAKGLIVRRYLLVFGIGFAIALAIGWVAFPRVLYSRQQQPLDFFHKTHADKSGLAQCDSCHVIGSDGQYSGIPRTEICAGCHTDKLGSTQDEALLVDNYVKQSKQTPWLVYSRQPANVWFSHAIHTRRAGLACTECHGNYGQSDQTKVYEQNRISGYSRDIWGHSISRLRRAPHDGMKMTDCESCHRRHHVEVGCLGCHQ